MQKKDLKLKKRLGLNFSSGKGNQTTLTGSCNGNTSSSAVKARDHIPKPVLNFLPLPPPDRELCPPLPKSQFLSSESGKRNEDNSQLPPPNMEYLTRKPHLPLKWMPSRQCSSHVVDDDNHTVFLIGTRDCEQDTRRTFMATIFGKEAVSFMGSTKGSEPDYGLDLADKEVDYSVPASKRSFVIDEDNHRALKRGLVHDNATALKRGSDAKRSDLADAVSKCVGKLKSSSFLGNRGYISKMGASSSISPREGRGEGRGEGGKGGGEERGVSTRPSTSAAMQESGLAVGKGAAESSSAAQPPLTGSSSAAQPPLTESSSAAQPPLTGSSSAAQPPVVCVASDVDYDTSTDMELLQDPAFLRDFIDDSDSSSDLDLPRVNVTGRYSKGKGKGKAREAKPSTSRSQLGEASSRRSDVTGSLASFRERDVWKVTGNAGASGGASGGGAGANASASGSASGSGGAGASGGTGSASGGASGSAGAYGSDMWEMTSQGSSKLQGGVVERCPICQTSFPPGCTQYNADEHIAMCLAVNMDEFQ